MSNSNPVPNRTMFRGLVTICFGLVGLGLVLALQSGCNTRSDAVKPPAANFNLGAPAGNVDHVPASPAGEVNLTVYNRGFAVVQEDRTVTVKQGANQVLLDGIPTAYRPQTLLVVSVAGGDLTVNSASYQPANLSVQKLLTESIGKQVKVSFRRGVARDTVEGTLVAASESELILVDAERRTVIVSARDVVTLGDLPAGLSRRAALLLQAQAQQAGARTLKLAYQTNGFSWSANHTVVYDEASGRLLKLETNAAVQNNSGAAFKGARLKLLAGDVGDNSRPRGGMRMMSESAPLGAAPAGFSGDAAVESVGEQKVYTVPSKVDLAENENKQVGLLSALNVPVTAEYYLPPSWQAVQAGGGKESVQLRLKLVNDDKSSLGKALPAGSVRVYQTDKSGTLQLTGTTSVGHVAVGEKFNLELGAAGDLKAERKRLSVKEDPRPKGVNADDSTPRFREETWQVTLYNYKTDRDVTVTLNEEVGENAQILNPSVGFTKESATRHTASVSVSKGGNTVVTYTVKTQVN